MTWQSNSISPTSTSPATDIGKIKNDLAQLKAVLGGGTDGDIPVSPRLKNADDTNPLALDWYQEGTFTPTVVGSTTAGSASSSLYSGRYTRIGNIVFVEISVAWASHTGTGSIVIQNLPFSTLDSGIVFGMETSDFWTGYSGIGASIDGNYLTVYARNNSTGALTSLPFPGTSASVSLYFKGHYYVDLV